MDFKMDLGALLGSVISGTGLGIGRSGMHAPTPEQQGADILREAAAAGLSPALLAGQQPQTGFGASTGDPGTAGQLLARAIHSDSPAEQRLAALKEAQMTNDVVEGQLRNSMLRVQLAHVGTSPPRPYGWKLPQFSTDDVWGALTHGSQLAPKASLQPFFTDKGTLGYGPSAAMQASFWSPVIGLTGNPWAVAEVTRANAGGMPAPPDVLRMTGLPPGAYNFLPGTAPGWGEAAAEGRYDPLVYGNPLW